jgi:translation initiation factor IF-2
LAKNLKLTIKNTQLAEALNLGKVKKPAAKKAKKEEALPPAFTEEAAPPPAPPVEAAPPPRKEKENPDPVAEVLSSPAPFKESLPPITPAEPPAPPKQEREREAPPQREFVRPRESFAPREQSREPLRPTPPQPRTHEPLRPILKNSPEYRHDLARGPGSGPRTGYGPRPPYRPGGVGGPGGPRREYQPPSPFRKDGPGDQRRPFSPRPPLRPGGPPSAQKHDKPSDRGAGAPRKNPVFKEFREVKPTRKVNEGKAFDSRDRQGLRSSDDEAWRKKRAFKGRGGQEELDETIRPKTLHVRLPISIKDLAVEMKLKSSQLVAKLFMQGVVATLNDALTDETTVQLLGHDFGCEITIDTREEQRLQITGKTVKQEIQETDPEQLITRAPVVAFMGHVDHGKTSLIDAIRKTNMAAGEAGAITQHIGAFKCHTAVGDIAILDTPGHEAFSEMRARGADVTDIVVLVVAGDEGMRTQTIEALTQARAASVPIVVALNKSDKAGFNPENVYRQLADNELLPESWGGTTLTVNCSAITGAGIKELLETLALQSEVLELKASPQARARGTVIESEMHKGLGAVATLLVQNGTLRVGDSLVFGDNWARVKTMHDEHGKALKEAGPSTPVKITGLSGLPEAGSEFIIVKDEREARELSHGRSEGRKSLALQQNKRASLESMMQKKTEKEKKVLKLILRADVQGSLEALKTSIMKIASEKAEANIISAAVGEISESDIQLAGISSATIIGFHTRVEAHAEQLIKQMKVTVRLHDIIYHAVDDIKELMKGLLDKIPQENELGEALVKTTFKASQLGVIAGCQVTTGLIRRNAHARLIRGGNVVWKGSIASLKRVKEDVKEMSKGHECGILLQGNNDVKTDDIIQAYDITYLEQDL